MTYFIELAAKHLVRFSCWHPISLEDPERERRMTNTIYNHFTTTAHLGTKPSTPLNLTL